MAIVKMKKLRVIAMADRRDELMKGLLRLGCVEISEPDDKLADPAWSALVQRSGSCLVTTKNEIGGVNTALEAIRKYGKVKDGLFVKRQEISEDAFYDAKEQAHEISEKIGALLQTLSRLQSEENRLQAQRAALTPWKSLDFPLERSGTEHVLFRLGVCPAATETRAVQAELADLSAELIEVSADKQQKYYLLICHKADEEAVQERLRPYGYSVTSFSGLSGTAAENLQQLENRLEENRNQQEETVASIAAEQDGRDILRVYADQLASEAEQESSAERLLTNGTIVFFEGWARADRMGKIEALMDRVGCAWETAEPEEGEEPPVLLDNPNWMRPINMVTEMYSLPAYRGIDPNPLIFFTYIFFFGFMFADVAYGLIIFIVSYLITKKYHPKGTMGYMFRLGQYLGISTAICGFFVGGFFGNVLDVIYTNFLPNAVMPDWMRTFCDGIIVNPVNDPMTVLVIAVIIGCIQLIFGQCVHIYMGFRDGKAVDYLLDVVPWWVVFAGIGVLALGHGGWLLIVGVICLIATQGRHKKGIIGKLFGGIASLYDITSWLSDILSYARLMALMLATSVIAQVMNTLGALPGSIIAFVIIFLIGHTFNVGVNLIGTYVHAARLHYLEFFSKFYEEGGVPFKPLAYKTKYVDIVEEEK